MSKGVISVVALENGGVFSKKAKEFDSVDIEMFNDTPWYRCWKDDLIVLMINGNHVSYVRYEEVNDE